MFERETEFADPDHGVGLPSIRGYSAEQSVECIGQPGGLGRQIGNGMSKTLDRLSSGFLCEQDEIFATDTQDRHQFVDDFVRIDAA